MNNYDGFTDDQYDNVVLLLHADGQNSDASRIIDSSKYNTVLTNVGQVTSNTAAFRYGMSSIYFNGASYIATPNSPNYSFGTGDFTLEMWVYPNGNTPGQGYFTNIKPVDGFPSWYFIQNNGLNTLYFSGAGGAMTSSGNVTLNSWNHVAVTRSGSTFRMFIGGTQVGSFTSTAALDMGVSDAIVVGQFTLGSFFLRGNVDEARITKGVARYTSNFTVPNEPFLPAVYEYPPVGISDPFWPNTTLLLHGDDFTDLSPIGVTMANTGTTINNGIKKFGSGSLSFNGTSSTLLTPSSPNYAFGSGNFTIEFWINPTNIPGLGATMSNYTDGAPGANKWNIYMAGPTMFMNFTNVGTPLQANTPTSPTIGTWTHCAFVRRGNDLLIFKNGVMSSSIGFFGSSPVDLGVTQFVYIGTNSFSGQGFVNGFIDDLRITKGVARYTSNFNDTPMFTGDSYWSNTTLLLHGDDFTDSGPLGTTLTNTGSVTINNGIKQFGTGSLRFNRSNYLTTTPSSTNYAFGSGDFTIEFWINLITYGSQDLFFYNRPFNTSFGTDSFVCGNNGTNKITVGINNTGSIFGASTLTTNVWYHIAIVRRGTTLSLYLNGILDGSTTSASAVDNGTATVFTIGSALTGRNMDGYLDDFRITKGFARYTSNFTVPASAFPSYPAYGFNSLETMNANTFTYNYQSYGNGQYIARASSILGASNYEWYAFNKVNPTNASNQLAWTNSSTTAYNATSGLYTAGTYTTTVSGLSYAGEWLQLQAPSMILVTGYSLTSPNHTSNTWMGTPGTWVIGGSNDGTTWNLLDNRDSQMFTSNNQTLSYSLSVPNSNTYSYYRLVATKLQTPTGGNYAYIGEWRLFADTVQRPNVDIEWPPAAMTVNTTTFSSLVYGNGTYVASASSSFGSGYEPFTAFNKTVSATNADWAISTAVETYNTTTGEYATGSSSTSGYPGAWLQLQMPVAVVLTSYSIQAPDVGNSFGRAPNTWRLYASNNGSTWIQIDERSAQVFTSNRQVFTYTINNSTQYTYYRLAVNRVNLPSDTYLQIGDWRLFGTPVSTSNYTYLDGSGNDQAPSLTLDQLGNRYLVVSNVQTTANIFNLSGARTNLLPVTSNRTTLVKYDPSGIAQWRTTWGGIASSALTPNSPSATTSNGDTVYVDSVLNGTLTFFNANDSTAATLTLANNWSNPVIVEYNSAGVYQWSQWIPTTSTGAIAQSCTVDSAGSVYVTGRSNSGVIMYPASGITIPASSGTGAFLVKYNSAGVCQWASRGVDGSANDSGTMVTSDGSNVYLSTVTATGTATIYNSTGTTFATTIPSSTNTRAVVKYNSGGFAQFVVCVAGDATTTVGTGCTVDSNQNMYVWGQKNSGTSLIYNAGAVSSGVSVPATTGIGAYVVEYNSAGVYQWFMYIDGSGTDIVTGLDVDLYGTVYVSGQSSTGGGTIFTSAGTTGFTMPVTTAPEMFIATFTQTGALSTFEYGTTTGSSLSTNSLVVDKSSLTVYTAGTVTGGGLTLNTFSNVTMTTVPTVTNQGVFVVQDRPGLEWPPAALTANTFLMTGQTYGNGQYYVTASTSNTASYYASFAFNKSSAQNDGWISSTTAYSTTTGGYNGSVSTSVSGFSYSGEWIQIQYPNPVSIVSYSLTSYNSGAGTFHLCTPNSWVICGSNDATTWNNLDIQSSQNYNAYRQTRIFNVENTNRYSYYRLIARTIQASSGYGACMIGELKFFGYPSYTQVPGDPFWSNTTLLLHADDFTDSSPVGTTLTNTGSVTPVTINDGIKQFGTGSFSFNGSNHLTTPSSSNYTFGSGNWTIEFWMNPSFINTNRVIVGNSNGTWTAGIWQLQFQATTPNQLAFGTFSHGNCINNLVTMSIGTWYHVAISRNGSTITLYVNGRGATMSIGTNSLDSGVTNIFNIGHNGLSGDTGVRFNGYIDDLRITKGIARYTSNFVVPGFAFPDARGTMVEWPPAALTGASTTLSGYSYGNGTYTVTASSVANSSYDAWRAFDNGVTSTSSYASSASPVRYDATGTYVGSTVTSGVSGEWIDIVLPTSVTVTSFVISARTDETSSGALAQNPTVFTLFGSNDGGTTWSSKNSTTGVTWGVGTLNQTFTVSSPSAFTKYRLVVNKVGANPAGGFLFIAQLRLFGY